MTCSRHSPTTHLSFLSLLSVFLAATHLARGYKFTLAAEPSQCGNFTVQWDGGRAPYELLLVPVGHVNPEIRTIVDLLVDSGNSASLTLKFPEGSQFVASLSDASAVGAGGTSDVLTVTGGPPDCLSGPVQAGWVLYMDNPTPDQCSPTRISWDEHASGQVSMWGIIPGGNTFDMGAPPSGTGWNWIPNVKEGTRMMIVAGDSKGRGTGGSTDLFAVGGGSSGCIDNSSPGTTGGPPAGQVAAVTPTDTSSGNPPSSTSGNSSGSGPGSGSDNSDESETGGSHDGTSSGGSDNPSADSDAAAQTNPSDASSDSPSAAAIAGIVLGILAGLLLALLALFFCLRSRRRRQRAEDDSFNDMRARGDLLTSGAPSIAGSAGVDSVITRAPHENVPRAYEPTPFVIRPRGGEFDPAIIRGGPLVRSHSGYSADMSDGPHSTYGHGRHSGLNDDELAGVQLLAPSPLPTPFQEKHAHLNPFSDAAVVPVPLNRTPSDSPPSFKTRATGGHSTRSVSVHEQQSEGDADDERMSPVHRYPSLRRTGPLRLVPPGGLSAWSLGEAEVPPSYDSWHKVLPIHNGFVPDPDSRFVRFEDEKASSSGHS